MTLSEQGSVSLESEQGSIRQSASLRVCLGRESLIHGPGAQSMGLGADLWVLSLSRAPWVWGSIRGSGAKRGSGAERGSELNPWG